MLDYVTGELLPGGLHNFSAPSKESAHLGMLALALFGNPYATAFIRAQSNTSSVVDAVVSIMERKMDTYEQFNATYPGFGGFMPWVFVNDSGIYPDGSSWANQVRVISAVVPQYLQ